MQQMMASGGTLDCEAALVARAQRDPLQFAPLYDLHFRRVYRFAYARVGERALAEDVTSDVFMKALGALPRYRDTGRPFAAWLIRIAANTIADRSRRQRPSQPIDDMYGLPACFSTEELAMGRDEIRRIGDLVRALPKDQTTAIVLRYQEDLNIDAIAEVMGRSSGAVKVLIWRALRNLRAEALRLRPAA